MYMRVYMYNYSLYLYVCTCVFGDHLVQGLSLLCYPSLEKLIMIIIIRTSREEAVNNN